MKHPLIEVSKNTFGEEIETIGGITLNLAYWDCNCYKNYIQPISINKCPDCGAEQEDNPSSRDNEVKTFLGRK